jgi:hypothetical protein
MLQVPSSLVWPCQKLMASMMQARKVELQWLHFEDDTDVRIMVQGMHPEFDDEWETLGCVWIMLDRRGNQFPRLWSVRVDELPHGQATTEEEVREPEYYYDDNKSQELIVDDWNSLWDRHVNNRITDDDSDERYAENKDVAERIARRLGLNTEVFQRSGVYWNDTQVEYCLDGGSGAYYDNENVMSMYIAEWNGD